MKITPIKIERAGLDYEVGTKNYYEIDTPIIYDGEKYYHLLISDSRYDPDINLEERMLFLVNDNDTVSVWGHRFSWANDLYQPLTMTDEEIIKEVIEECEEEERWELKRHIQAIINVCHSHEKCEGCPLKIEGDHVADKECMLESSPYLWDNEIDNL